MNKHTIWMIIGCAIPLLLIFFAPALGLSGNASLLLFIIAMFLVHIFMHGRHLKKDDNHHHLESHKDNDHEHHRH
jgi:cell division protein FtsW (lipid II flippase)